MSIKPLLNSNSIDNKTLNLFGNTLSVNNVDTTTINGTPIGGSGVQNPLTENLKLDGFAIVEELGLAPSLNIDQLDITKDIKLKIAGISKVDVKNNEIQLNENLNLNNNSLLNSLGLNTQFLSATSQIETSLLVGLGAGSLPITSNDLTLTENNLAGGEYMNFNNVRTLSYKPLDMNNNNINNVNALGANQVNTDIIENSGSGFLTFTNLGSYIPSFTAGGLDMNDAELLNINNIRTNTQPIFTINKNGSNATEIYGNSTIRRLQISNGVYLLSGTDLFCGNNNIQQCGNLEVSTINGISPVGGLYASTSAGTLINNTTTQSLVALSGVGSLSIPPNAFSVGDCFHLVITGDCVFTNNDEIQITLKQNGNILAQTPSFLLEDANSGNNVFEIEADFNIRSIGVGGSIHTSFEFTYNKDSIDSKDFRGTRSNDTQTINTTIASTLDVEFQFITKNASSSIQTQLFRLQKVY